MKASIFVKSIKEYLEENGKLYNISNEMGYPYCDLYGFTSVNGLKTQIVLIPEKEEKPYYDRIDQFPEKRLKLDTILDLIQKEVDENGDRELYYKTFNGKKELINYWQTSYGMIVPMNLED